ncbi:hypothetical protein E2C01_065648 [Portunus trituberculatus]|uniref:Uncharacterized protein n=1 Tax=Portunus trituberculatus TaxID=210409 RepID=A0A5B7HF44_PORTR|nr:hypothetical protein [Portunus trituberculatus]
MRPGSAAVLEGTLAYRHHCHPTRVTQLRKGVMQPNYMNSSHSAKLYHIKVVTPLNSTILRLRTREPPHLLLYSTHHNTSSYLHAEQLHHLSCYPADWDMQRCRLPLLTSYPPPSPNPPNDFRLESPIQPLSSDSHQHHPSTLH